MKKILIGCGALGLGLALLALLVVGGIYNNLVSLQEGVDAAWSQVENVYQRRADLVPNLVNTVKGAADFEQETLQAVVDARAKVGQTQIEGAPSADQMAAFQANQDALSSALSRLLVVVERYPDLKADKSFQQLGYRISELEDQIADRREFLNESVNIYNIRVEQFPDVLVARLFNFARRTLWRIDPEQRQDVRVEFQHT